jgi:hypothetical protein
MRKFIHYNSLSIVFFTFFLLCLVLQFITGFNTYNADRVEDGLATVNMYQYLKSGHFLQATFENWESEFFQMGLFVVLTIFLRQKGSSESKGFEGKEEVDRAPSARRKNAPWPVRKGGVILLVYKHSLSIALFLLFIVSFIVHFYGSLKDENEKLLFKGDPLVGWEEYMQSSRFWFESFQNWQSEFFSVFILVVLSIFLRQLGSPQSKPVDAPHAETGVG